MGILTAQTKAVRHSTFVITAEFKDELGNLVIPVNAYWSLLRTDGEIINEREGLPLAFDDYTATVVLSGEDLEGGKQIFFVDWVYNSTLGSDLPGKSWLLFEVIKGY